MTFFLKRKMKKAFKNMNFYAKKFYQEQQRFLQLQEEYRSENMFMQDPRLLPPMQQAPQQYAQDPSDRIIDRSRIEVNNNPMQQDEVASLARDHKASKGHFKKKSKEEKDLEETDLAIG